MNEAPGNPRHLDERAAFARGKQDTPNRLGKVAVFSGSESDGIAMTGEEDPLAEVDTDGFADHRRVYGYREATVNR